MAIDQEIQQKVDAYRNNPQALQQRYAQNQQLVDLLALQKIKSEMDAAKRDIQMKMQQQPGTIKQQREQELMQRTKQEMMDQTAGVMRQKQAQQQQNIQKVAQGGLGAIAQQRPAPAQQIANQSQPMPRMAAGGIVAFQQGGLSSMAGLSDADVAGMTPERLAELRRTDPERYRAIRNELARRQREAGSDYSMYGGEAGRTDTDAVARERPQRPSLLSRGLQALNLQGSQSIVPGSTAMPPEQGPEALGPETFAPAVERQGPEDFAFGIGADAAPRRAGGTGPVSPTRGPDDGLRGGPVPEDTAAPPSATGAAANIPTDSGGLAGLGVGVGTGNAEAAMERGFARADQYTGREEKAGRYAEMEERLAALDEELYDPAEERRDQLKAFLIGTAGRGSTALAGGAASSMNLRADQKAARRQRLIDQFDMAERGMALDKDLANMGLSLGREMYAQVSANNRAALSAAASLRTAELRNQMEAAKLQYQERRDNDDRSLREQELAVNAADAAAARTTADLGTTSAALDRLISVQDAEIERQMDAQGIPELNVQLSFADEETAAQLEQEIARRTSIARIDANTILNESGVLDAQERLTARLIDLTGIDTSDLPALEMEDIEDITYNE